MNSNSEVQQRHKTLESSWFKEAYMSAKEFYEKDNVLDSRDRHDLSNYYKSIARAQLWGGWFGFTAVFLTPFAYKFYKTNAIRGVNIPRNFVLGIGAMILATQTSGDYMFRKTLRDLDPEGQLEQGNKYGDEELSGEVAVPKRSNQRKYDMMRLLNNGGASKWAAYFHITQKNPERRFPNPAVKLQAMEKGETRPSSFLNQRDPLGLYSESSRDETQEHTNQSQGDGVSSSWDKIRQESTRPRSSWNRLRNGAESDDDTKQESNDKYLSDDPFFLPDQPSQSDFDALVQNEREGKDNYD